MLKIEINIPYPKQALAFIAVGFISFLVGTQVATGGGVGGFRTSPLWNAEEKVRKLREEQGVLSRQEEILRIEFVALEKEVSSLAPDDTEVRGEIREARERLLTLLASKRGMEEKLRESLYELWGAQERARGVAEQGKGTPSSAVLRWPVEPEEGISSGFLDRSYEERFGLPHYAVDIPTSQGTTVRAAASGKVVDVSDHGFGFNTLTVDHGGGLVTLYGHVSEFLVEKGEAVRAGDPIAYSGGRPGSRGAGHLSTGPHVHFEVFKNGEHIDPLELLPLRTTVVMDN